MVNDTLMPSIGPSDSAALSAFAERLADAAAEITLRHFRADMTVDNKEKTGFDPVTIADRGAEDAIRALIETTYPDHGIEGEERPPRPAEGPFTWILDPIDGTRSFICGVPTWGTLIALLYEGRPVIGVIDQPYLKERYVGSPLGTTLNGNTIRTRACTGLSDAVMSTVDPDLFQDGERAVFDTLKTRSKLIRYSLDCYAYAILSAGHFDLILETRMKPYDIMALVPVIRGAGGMVTDWSGNEPGPDGRLVALGDPGMAAEVLPLLTV